MKKFQILNDKNEVIYEFKDINFLVFSEIFSFEERQLFRESLQTNEPIKEGKFKGYTLQKV